MSTLSRFAPAVARSALFQQRHMASAAASMDPVQKMFVDKVREFKAANKGLDESHQRLLQEEMKRLRRVYGVEDESKLAQMEFKFPSEINVNLHDVDDGKALRAKIHSGEIQKELVAQTDQQSELLATIPVHDEATRPREFYLPMMNKPDPAFILESAGIAQPITIPKEQIPDYEFVGEKMTPEGLEKVFRVKFASDMPTINDDKSPQRDTVNYPRVPMPLDCPPTRNHIIPESWFRFFYPKTGVTGPYTFAFTVGTFLYSKEWLICEHHMGTGFSMIIIFTYLVTKFGPKLRSSVIENLDREIGGWENWRLGSIKVLDEMREHYKKECQKGDLLDEIYNIRRQDVEVQLEGEYRNRLHTAYLTTKKRLDYLVSAADSQRQIYHSNMVNWVKNNAISSFGPKQEADVLDNCIANLKKLARENPNAI